MIKSMTGYGRGQYSNEQWDVSVEIKTVNHRYVDINIKASKQIMFMESDIKKRIQQQVVRGKVDVVISYKRRDAAEAAVGFDEETFKAYMALLKRLICDYGLNGALNVSDLINLPGVLGAVDENVSDDPALIDAIFRCLDQSLEALVAMRSIEGRNLYADIVQCLGTMRGIVDDIKSRAGKVLEEYRDKLAVRIQELIGDIPVDPDRIAMEAAIYADKSDITEEITRLYSHIEQFKEAVDADVPVGRKLDFITQEIYREFNTIASKATDVDIINGVIEAKAITEKLREQIQNIE